MKKLLLALLFIVGCVTPTIPYVREGLVGPLPRDWASRLGTAIKTITVYNPTAEDHVVEVWCKGWFFDSHSYHTFKIKAYGEAYAFVEVNDRDLVATVCQVSEVDGIKMEEK